MVRQFLDIGIFMSRHVILVYTCLFILWIVIGPYFNLDEKIRRLCRSCGPWMIYLPTLMVLVVFLGIGMWYFQIQGYAGEVEPMISSVSWLVNHGEPLYHPIDSPTRYSVLYGPSVYLTNGFFLQLFGASLGATKLASLLAIGLSLVFLYGAVAKRRLDTLATMAVLLAVLYFWNQGFSIYLVRPDAFLVFAVSFGLLVVQRSRGWLAWLALGGALGFAINLKIHALLYFLPVLVIFLRQQGVRSLVKSLLFGALVVVAPFFLHPQISGTNYLLWLKNAMGHGLGVETLASTSRYGLALLMPVLAVAILDGHKGRWIFKDKLLTLSLVGALLGCLVLSSKHGAGLVHLLPLVPVFVFVAAHRVSGLDHSHWTVSSLISSRLFWGRTAVAVMFVTLMISGSVHTYRSSMLVKWQNRNTDAVAKDLKSIMADFKDFKISMACGGEEEFFRSTFLRPLLVFADNPLLIDPIAVMDCRKAGMDLSESTFKAIKDGRVGVWLVPRNQKPFSKTNWYAPHEAIFPERFLDYFLENYSRRTHSEFFDLWFWNGFEQDPKINPAMAAIELIR